MPEISIITPVYADIPEKVSWLGEMINSLNQQTFSDWEAIIVDDFSPHSLDPVKSIADKRCRFFRTSHNCGPSLCRNTGVALAESEAILPLDADDQLGEADVLETMFDHWKDQRDLIIYGDLQRLKDGEKGRIFELAEYTFPRAYMDLNGIIPVTGLHSKECHIKAGGWKTEIEAGLEDVEYWIAAGKAGFCGKHIKKIILLYRQHQTSRAFKLRRVNRRETEMRNLIREMHKDIYEGRFPMGCCGNRGTATPLVSSAQQAQSQRFTTLDQFEAGEKTWVQYNGQRTGSWGIIGPRTQIRYSVEQQGHRLEVHNDDLSIFRRSGRGRHFVIGVAPPQDFVSIPDPEPPTTEPFVAPPPSLAEIERLDRLAAETRGLDLEPIPPSPMPPPSPEPILETIQPQSIEAFLQALNLGENLISAIKDNWTVQTLSQAKPEELTTIKGIGKVRAKKIIREAKEFINGQS